MTAAVASMHSAFHMPNNWSEFIRVPVNSWNLPSGDISTAILLPTVNSIESTRSKLLTPSQANLNDGTARPMFIMESFKERVEAVQREKEKRKARTITKAKVSQSSLALPVPAIPVAVVATAAPTHTPTTADAPPTKRRKTAKKTAKDTAVPASKKKSRKGKTKPLSAKEEALEELQREEAEKAERQKAASAASATTSIPPVDHDGPQPMETDEDDQPVSNTSHQLAKAKRGVPVQEETDDEDEPIPDSSVPVAASTIPTSHELFGSDDEEDEDEEGEGEDANEHEAASSTNDETSIAQKLAQRAKVRESESAAPASTATTIPKTPRNAGQEFIQSKLRAADKAKLLLKHKKPKRTRKRKASDAPVGDDATPAVPPKEPKARAPRKKKADTGTAPDTAATAAGSITADVASEGTLSRVISNQTSAGTDVATAAPPPSAPIEAFSSISLPSQTPTAVLTLSSPAPAAAISTSATTSSFSVPLVIPVVRTVSVPRRRRAPLAPAAVMVTNDGERIEALPEPTPSVSSLTATQPASSKKKKYNKKAAWRRNKRKREVEQKTGEGEQTKKATEGSEPKKAKLLII